MAAGGERGDTVLCTLDAGDFVLTMEPVLFLENAPVNTLLRLRVRSGAFAGEGRLDVGREALAQFAAALDRLYRTLGGAAAIEEPYPGLPEQELRFAAQFDQTYLRPFVLKLQKIIPNA